jgi:hypothetical protein
MSASPWSRFPGFLAPDSVLASYAGFSLGARLRVASGMPRTPVTGAFFSASTDTYEPIFGLQNSERLPTFSSIDLRVEKIFRVKRFAVTPYTNRKNAVDYAYSADFSQRAMVTGLSMTLVAGVALKL